MAGRSALSARHCLRSASGTSLVLLLQSSVAIVEHLSELKVLLRPIESALPAGVGVMDQPGQVLDAVLATGPHSVLEAVEEPSKPLLGQNRVMTPRTACFVAITVLTSGAACASQSGSDSPDERTRSAETTQGAQPRVAAECTPLIRRKGITYRAYGYTSAESEPFSTAEVADCDDLGPDAPGSTFAGTPPMEAVETFEDLGADQVLAVEFDEDTYTVFIAESVPRPQGEAILAELNSPKSP